MIRHIAIVVLLALTSAAAGAPTLSETNRLKIVNAYQRALLAQAASRDAQQALSRAVAAYNEIAEQARKDEKLPKDASFKVDVDSGTVTVELPEPAKTDVPKEKK